MKNGEKEFDIQEYMTEGVERIVSEALKATLKNPRESAFMLKFAAASRTASRKRKKAEKKGEHIPPFLIASITSKCNLHCAGCYSRCNQATVDSEPVSQLSGEDWLRIFDEADDLGISFILLAGGEPMLRRDVIESAATKPNILFPETKKAQADVWRRDAASSISIHMGEQNHARSHLIPTVTCGALLSVMRSARRSLFRCGKAIC